MHPCCFLVLVAVAVTAGAVHQQKIYALDPCRDPIDDILVAEALAKAWKQRHPACKRCRPSVPPLRAPLRSVFDQSYIIEVMVGSPEQSLLLELDTGSIFLWVIDPSCSSIECKGCPASKYNKTSYVYGDSTTFFSNHTPYSYAYAGGVGFEGFLGRDKLRFGETLIPNMDIGVATAISTALGLMPADGMFGMGLPRRDPAVPLAPLESLGVDVFTVHLTRHEKRQVSKEGGTLTLGGTDPVHCETVINYVNVTIPELKEDRHDYWLFDIAQFKFNGYESEREFTAMTDTGAWTISGPREEIGAFRRANKAQYDNDRHAMVAPCDTEFIPMFFNIGGVEYTIGPEQLVLDIYDGITCALAVDYAPVEVGIPEFILGAPFIRAYCNTHDGGKSPRIGFAKAK